MYAAPEKKILYRFRLNPQLSYQAGHYRCTRSPGYDDQVVREAADGAEVGYLMTVFCFYFNDLLNIIQGVSFLV